MQFTFRSLLLASLLLSTIACNPIEDGQVNAVTSDCDGDDCFITLNISLQGKDGLPIEDGLSLEDIVITDLVLTAEDAVFEPEDKVVTLEDVEVIDIIFRAADPDGTSIVMLLDQSGSMVYNDPDWQRFQAAKELTETFLVEGTYENEAALMTFPFQGNSMSHLAVTDVWQDTTSDSELMFSSIEESLQPPEGGTPFYLSVSENCRYLETTLASNDKARSIIAMTDGDDTTSIHWGEAARTCNESDASVYIAGLGKEVKEDDLHNLARETGGFYVPASVGTLSKVFSNLADTVTGSIDITVRIKDSSNATQVYPGFTYQAEGNLIVKKRLELEIDAPLWVAESPN